MDRDFRGEVGKGWGGVLVKEGQPGWAQNYAI